MPLQLVARKTIVEETFLGVSWTVVYEGMEVGFKEIVGREGRLEKLERWGLVDVMPSAGDLDEGRED